MAGMISGSFTEDQVKKLNAISNDAANETRKKSQTLDKDAFLKIMMIQLQNQNPLSPTDNAEYMNQMAQFSSVEQLTNLVSSQSTANEMSALISKQLEDMAKMISKLATTSGESTEISDKQTQIIEQNNKMLEQLVKMNATLSAYMESNKPAVSDAEVFSALGL